MTESEIEYCGIMVENKRSDLYGYTCFAPKGHELPHLFVIYWNTDDDIPENMDDNGITALVHNYLHSDRYPE